MFRSKLAALLAFGIIALIGAAQPASEKKTDVNGDPLPAGALARMGSLRWRHGDVVSFVAFTSDGKAVLTASNDSAVRLWDRETGRVIRTFDLPNLQPANPNPNIRVLGWNAYGRGVSRLALSPDGKLLAAATLNNSIQVWNVETGKPAYKIDGRPIYISSLVFSPDSKLLAGRGNDRTIHIYDAADGKSKHEIKGKQQQAGGARILVGGANGADGLAFSHDGKIITHTEMEFDMQKLTTHLRLVEVATGKDLRSIELGQNGGSTVAFSLDGKLLAHGKGTNVVCLDADGGKEVRTILTPGAIAGIHFSPDSKTIAIKGIDRVVRLFDAANGNKIHELGESAFAPGVNAAFIGFNQASARDFAFSHDGKQVAMGGSQTLRFFTVATGKEVAAGGNAGHSNAVTAVLLTPDGKTLVSRGADGTIRRWDAADGKEIGKFQEPKGTTSAVFAPDGKIAALANADGTIRIVAIADGSVLHSVKGHQNGAGALAFSPDSKMLASRGAYDGTIRLFDTVKGGEIKTLTLAGMNPAAGGNVVIRTPYGVGAGLALAFSPDGHTIATNVNPSNAMIRNPGGGPVNQPVGAIHMFDIQTGKEIRKLTLTANRNVANLVYSPDGRILAAENADQTISLWEIASGRERGLLGTPIVGNQPGGGTVMIGGGGFGGVAGMPVASSTLALSADGSLIASRGSDNSVRVWEVAHAKEIGAFKGHNGAVNTLAFAADGKRLATGSADTTLLVWDVASLKRTPKAEAVNLQANEVDGLWKDLIGEDANRAGQSILKLASAPKQATAFLREQLKPAAQPDVKKIDQWVADLDSTNFAKRTQASVELEKLGELAIPALKKALTGQPTPETRRRIEPILEKLTTGTLSSEQLRLVRAVEVLEKIGNDDARAVLKTLAGGAPGALPTVQAQAVLDRLPK